ncbi:MAG: S41 family peptidase, partial [Planctomycetota bacterium]
TQMGSGSWEATKTGEIAEDDEGDTDEDEVREVVEIDADGFEDRAMLLPIARGNFSGLVVNDKNQLLYARSGNGLPSLKLFDMTEDKPSEGEVIGAVLQYDLSADGKKLMVVQAGPGGVRYGVVNAAKGQSVGEPLPTDGMEKQIDPKAEWKQLVTDAWRRHRDYFYVENMHGVDWEGVLDQYLPMVDDAASREDVSYIIGEMIGELNVGHAYYFGGDVEGQPSENVGLLGNDFTFENGAYRISKIYGGGPFDADVRSPLAQPGLGVSEGDYLLAVNDELIADLPSPHMPFIGKVGQMVRLTVSDQPTLNPENENQRDVLVKPIGSDNSLRYRHWINSNRERVYEMSDGKIGYIYVPNTGVQGQNDLFRQFFGQMHMDALIIDERWNGGGQIPNRFIELLDRPRTNYWKRRHGRDWAWPPESHQGPKAMLINGLAGSGGDMFPWLFREHELGKLIGTRTWGGLVGISGVPPLIDGGYTAVPNFGFYETDGTWGIEGHGVDPDIEVLDDPAKMQDGADPQLETAVAHLLEELENGKSYEAPKSPKGPVRTGIGIAEEDK